MAQIRREKLRESAMPHSKKYPKTLPDEKRYISPHVYCLTWSNYLHACEFTMMTGRFAPHFPGYGVPNAHLRGTELYDALVKANVDVEWEEVDRSPPAFHHGPYTDGIGRKYEFLVSDNWHRASEDFINDPARPPLRGAHDDEDARRLRYHIRHMSDDALASYRNAGDGSDEEEEQEVEADYPGAVKIDPALKRKGERSPRRMAAKQPRLRDPELPKRRKGQTLGDAKNEQRLRDGSKARGRPKKVKPDSTTAQDDSGNGEAAGSLGQSSVPEGTSSTPSPPKAVTDSGATSAFIPPGETVGQPLAGTQEDRNVQAPPAKAEGKATHGFLANLEREQKGMKKRGRPLGVKNKPK